MRKYTSNFILFILLNFTTLLYAQESRIKWARGMGGTGADIAHAIAVDTSGNVYTTGYFTGTADFDPGTNVYNLTADGYRGIQVSKLNAEGSLVWVKQFKGITDGRGLATTTDASGNVYITGWFDGTGDFDPGPNTLELKSTVGSNDIFIVKLDTSGNLIWAKNIGGEWGQANAIAVDKANNVYITGIFSGTVDFDPGSGVSNLSSFNGSIDIFISKLDKNGNLLWAKNIGSNAGDGGLSIAIDDTGNVYTTGTFRNSMNITLSTGINTTLSAIGSDDIFITKQDASGNFIWCKSVGGSGVDFGNSIKVDRSNNIIIAGYFNGTVDFDPGTGAYNQASKGGADIFVLKLNSTGEFIWCKTWGGRVTDQSLAVDIDNQSNIYTTGMFNDSVNFDPWKSNYSIRTNGFNDIYIAKMDALGNFVWARGMGSILVDYGTSITVDNKGALYATGRFTDTLKFGGRNEHYNLTSHGEADIFVCKLGECRPSVVDIDISACDKYVFNDSTITVSGNLIDTFENVDGCDSIVIHNITIHNSISNSVTVNACKNFSLNNHIYTESGTYTDTLTTAGNCDSILTIDLTVIHINTEVNQEGRTLIANEPGTSYQWIDCNNSSAPITGATQKEFTPNIDGSYAVIVFQNGCSDTSACFTLGNKNSIEKLNIENRFQLALYPNPTDGKLTLQTKETLHNAVIRLVSITGQELIKKTNQYGSLFTLDLKHCPAGIYFIELTEQHSKVRMKVIKE